MALEFIGFTRHVEIEDSQQITEVWYDYAMQKMRIQFHHQAQQYEYSDIAPEEFGQLISAESVGKMFNQIIRSKPTTKL